MYVDESGSISHKDSSKYFMLTGVIVSYDKIKELQRTTYDYKLKYFNDDYIDSEIHTHDIYQTRSTFSNLGMNKKQILLDELYNMISGLDITIISIAINKKLLKSTYPDYDVLKIAWIYLIERFDKFLEDNFDVNTTGDIKIDKSSIKIENDIFNIITDLKKTRTQFQRKASVDKIMFVDSSGVIGIQIADAVAYCSMMHVNNKKGPKNYWDLIYPKFRTNPDGIVDGYGWKIFPK